MGLLIRKPAVRSAPNVNQSKLHYKTYLAIVDSDKFAVTTTAILIPVTKIATGGARFLSGVH